MALPFQVTKQFAGGIEKVIAAFAEEKDAREFIQALVSWLHKTKVDAMVRLYSQSTILVEINAKEHETISAAETQERHSSITPFGTAPKPSGFPSSSRRHEDIDDEDE